MGSESVVPPGRGVADVVGVVEPVRSPGRGLGYRFGRSLGKTVLLTGLIVALWVAAIEIYGLSQLTLPHPLRVWDQGIANAASLRRHGWVTLYASMVAFALSAVIGVTVAAVLARFALLRSIFFPLIVALQAAPKIAIAPLLLVWLGFGTRVPIVIGFLVAVFPMIINTAVGLGAADANVLMLSQTMRASEFRTFVRIRLPYALPAILGGLKTALVLAIVGVVVGELTGGQAGLGYLLSVATSQFNMAYAFASLVLLVVGSLVLFYVLEFLERRFSWYEQGVTGGAR